MGCTPTIRIRGTLEYISACRNVVKATRRLHSSLNEGISLHDMRECINKKHVASQKFTAVTGIVWPLLGN